MTAGAQVVIHDLAQGEATLAAAAERGLPIQLRSAPGAAAYAGVGYLRALGDALGHELVVDCGDDAGLVMAALRTGCRDLAFDGPHALSQPLADMATQVGATLRTADPPPTVLHLTPDDDARAQMVVWLAESE